MQTDFRSGVQLTMIAAALVAGYGLSTPAAHADYVETKTTTVETAPAVIAPRTIVAPSAVFVPGAPAPVAGTTVVTTDAVVTPPVSTTSVHTSTIETQEVKKGVQFNFKERLTNLIEQINNNEAKGFLTAGQASNFKAQIDVLLSTTSNVEGAGWPKDGVDQLDKDITKLNADVSSAATASVKVQERVQ